MPFLSVLVVFFLMWSLITRILNQRERFVTSLHFNAGSSSLDYTLIPEDVLIKILLSFCIFPRIFAIFFDARSPGKKFAG